MSRRLIPLGFAAPEDQSNASELARAKQELQKMLLTKKAMHPDVQQKLKEIKSLEQANN